MRVSRLNRITLAVAVGALSISSAAPANSATTVPASFIITGSGFGHGIGMSQYGALAMARAWEAAPAGLTNCPDKSTADLRAVCIGKQVNTTYFPGTSVDFKAPIENFRVGIEQDVPNLYFLNPTGALTLSTDKNRTYTVPINTELQITSSQSMSIKWAGQNTFTASKVELSWSTGVLHYKTSTAASYKYTNGTYKKNYKYGSMEISFGKFPASGLYADSVADLQLVNILDMGTEYLYGLSEVSNSWPKGALIAQVIAARSYAWAHKTVNNSNCLCSVFDSTGSQVFVGYSKELQTNGALWRAAVDATIRSNGDQLYVMKGTTPISAFFSSSSGGKTQPANEVWGSDPTTYSYLTGIDDPWSVSEGANNPYANWQVQISQANLVAALNKPLIRDKQLNEQTAITDIASISIARKYDSGGVAILDVVDSGGNVKRIFVRPNSKWIYGEIDMTPDTLRSVIGAATLLPKANSAFNGSTYLHEFIPATDSTAGSTRTQTAKLKAATQSNWVSTARVGVSTVLSGELNPPQALVKVELQQKSSFSWKTVATSTSTNSGTWSFGYISQSAGLKTFRVKATNSKNSVNTISKSITFKSKVTLFGTTKAKVSSTVALNGSTIPARAGLTVIIERKVGTGIWKRVATTTTDDSGSWSLQGKTTSYAVTTRFRARLSDTKIGQATSKILRITVNK